MIRVAVIGGQPHAVMFARELGVEVVLVHEQGKYEDTFTEYCTEIVHAPLTDADAVLRALRPLHEERPFERVLSTSEDGAVATAHVAAALGLPGNSADTARTLKNKVLTRRALAEHGLSPVRYALVSSAQGVTDLLAEVGDRVVVKPVDGVASANVHVVTDPAGAEAAWSALAAAGYTEAIAEEYLDGPAISVESFSLGGRHVPIAMTQYDLNENFVEVGISVPSVAAQEHAATLRELTIALLDAVGLVEGPSHTEFVLTPAGPRVLESHNRLAGGGVPELVRRAYGLSLSRMFLSVPLGLEPLPEQSPESTGGAAISFFRPAPGVVTGIGGVDDLDVPVLRIPSGVVIPGVPRLADLADAEVGVFVQVNPGDDVPVIRAGWDRRMGYAIATGSDAADAIKKAEYVRDKVDIRTE